MDGWVILFSGCLAGLLNGWLGLGGMSIFIPTLIIAFGGVASGTDLMLMVLGNAFVVSLVNSLVSWASYHRHQTVNYAVLRYSQPSAVIGAVIAFAGAIAFQFVSVADRFFGAYLVLMAALVWWMDRRNIEREAREISPRKQIGFGFAGGIASGLIGFNGNSFFTPALRKAGLGIKQSVATAQVLGASIAATAAVTIAAYSFAFGVKVFVFKWIASLAVSSSVFSVIGAAIKRRMHHQKLSWAVSFAYAVTGGVLVTGILHPTSHAVAKSSPVEDRVVAERIAPVAKVELAKAPDRCSGKQKRRHRCATRS